MVKVTVTTKQASTVVNLKYAGESTPLQQTTGPNKKAVFEYVDDSAEYTTELADPNSEDKIVSTNHAVIE